VGCWVARGEAGGMLVERLLVRVLEVRRLLDGAGEVGKRIGEVVAREAAPWWWHYWMRYTRRSRGPARGLLWRVRVVIVEAKVGAGRERDADVKKRDHRSRRGASEILAMPSFFFPKLPGDDHDIVRHCAPRRLSTAHNEADTVSVHHMLYADPEDPLLTRLLLQLPLTTPLPHGLRP
jgi:hypothetical protein